jgi:hypothetical protein
MSASIQLRDLPLATKRRTEIVGALGRVRVLQVGIERGVVEDDVDGRVTADANASKASGGNEQVKNFEQLKTCREQKPNVIEGKITMRLVQFFLACSF